MGGCVSEGGIVECVCVGGGGGAGQATIATI